MNSYIRGKDKETTTIWANVLQHECAYGFGMPFTREETVMMLFLTIGLQRRRICFRSFEQG